MTTEMYKNSDYASAFNFHLTLVARSGTNRHRAVLANHCFALYHLYVKLVQRKTNGD